MGTYHGDILRAELKATLWQSLDNAVENGYAYEGDVGAGGKGVINADPEEVAVDSMDNDAEVYRICSFYDLTLEDVALLVEEWQESKR